MKKKALFLATITGLLVMCGCNKKEYNVDYDGLKDCYPGAKDSYAAGTKVKLKYDFIATDTDYSFYIDGERPEVRHKDDAFIITFIMPDHDIKIVCDSRETMHPDYFEDDSEGEQDKE